jgi:uncharacterized membrane protein
MHINSHAASNWEGKKLVVINIIVLINPKVTVAEIITNELTLSNILLLIMLRYFCYGSNRYKIPEL